MSRNTSAFVIVVFVGLILWATGTDAKLICGFVIGSSAGVLLEQYIHKSKKIREERDSD